MDPNQTLVEMRELIAKMTEGLYPPAMIAAAGELAEKFKALDYWMSRGGFAPEDWKHTV